MKVRGLLIGSSLALALAAAGAVAYGVVMVLDPPPERCPLPILRVPKPVADFTWSPDGKRLIAAGPVGEVWMVHFPELREERLPVFPQPIERTGWDREGRAWVVHAQGLARLRADHSGWERLPAVQKEAVSPDGRLTARFALRTVRRGGPAVNRRVLAVRARATGPERDFTLPWGDAWHLVWMDAERLLLHRRGQWRPVPLVYRPGHPRPRELFVDASPTKGHPSVRSEWRTGPAEDLHSWLVHTVEVPGMSYRPYWDKRISVTDARGNAVRRIPLGRRWHRAGGDGFWEAAKLSPDRRFAVLRAADDTLRVLDLQPRSGQNGR